MVNDKKQSAGASDIPNRRRGRPTGKNRVPLSREERRARNAQYERERRNETAEVMSQLMETVGCDPNMSNADLLATVISRIHGASCKKSSEDIADLERVNANLEAQIATLQSRLGLNDASLELSDNENDIMEPCSSRTNPEITSACKSDDYNLRKRTNKRKRPGHLSAEYMQQEKRTKTQSETWSVDSGIELRSHTVSPPEPCVPDNTQSLTHNEQHQHPVETTEGQDYDLSPAHTELQTELYNQIYNSEPQSYLQSIPGWNLGTSTESMPCMETLARSLILVPPIRSPQRDPSDSRLEYQTKPESQKTANVEPPCDVTVGNEGDSPRHDDEQTTLGFLTDTEKGLLSDWIGEEYVDQSKYYDDIQMERNYPFEDILQGFL